MRKLASVQVVKNPRKVEEADSLDVVTIQGWDVVVGRGVFEDGDKCLFLEVDSIVPASDLFPEKLRGKTLKTAKLRGQISQGLVVPLPVEFSGAEEGTDLSETLGVYKRSDDYQDSMPRGQTRGLFPYCIPKTDSTRVQSMGSANMVHLLEECSVTIKLDGTSVTYAQLSEELGGFHACSRNLSLKEADGTLYWGTAKALGLDIKIPQGIALQGELCGPGIQANPMGLREVTFFAFDAFSVENGMYLSHEDFVALTDSLGCKRVPLVRVAEPGSCDIKSLLVEADALGAYPGTGALMEGLVVKPTAERPSGRSFKAISNKFLLKKK